MRKPLSVLVLAIITHWAGRGPDEVVHIAKLGTLALDLVVETHAGSAVELGQRLVEALAVLVDQVIVGLGCRLLGCYIDDFGAGLT